MSKTYGYIRIDKIDTIDADVSSADIQRNEITEYTRRAGLSLDAFLEVRRPTVRTSRAQRIAEMGDRMAPGDVLLVVELCLLGKSTGEVIMLLNHLLLHGIKIIVIRQQLVFEKSAGTGTTNAMMRLLNHLVEVEHTFNQARIRSTLAAKRAKGIQLGKPRGIMQASMYDKDRERIRDLLRLGVSQRRILADHLGYGTPNSLNHYIRTRGLAVQHAAESHSPPISSKGE